jgi:hypothetical protein
LSGRIAVWFGLASLVALLLIVPYRHLSLNNDGPLSALMLIAAGMMAFGMGIIYKWRSGWCTTLCPIHPVERLYGFTPMMTFHNARCARCEHCTTPCPDSTRSMTPAINAPYSLATAMGHLMIGGFAGFIYGWNQLPDFTGNLTLHHYLLAYLWPFSASLVSLAIYAVLYHWFFTTKEKRRTLIKLFAVAAISTYYWFRIPALVGLGPFHGTGMLIDLSDILPPWTEHLSHLATTMFFIWFLVLRKSKKISWLKRPTLVRKRKRRYPRLALRQTGS